MAISRITLEVYTRAVTSHKRAAQSKDVKMMVKDIGETRVEITFKPANTGSLEPRTRLNSTVFGEGGQS